MGWFLLVGLGAIWLAFLLPTLRKQHSPGRSVKDFGRHMDLLADTGTSSTGRYIITPRKGTPFVGSRERARERARERRRQVFVVMLESIALTALIGLAPPLRVMWYVTAALLATLGVYVWMLISLKAREETHGDQIRATGAPQQQRVAAPQRYAADASSRTPRPAYNGLAALGGDDLTSIVVRPASESYA